MTETPLLDWPSEPPRKPAIPIGCPQDVADLFLSLSVSVHARGFRCYSADAILHRIRWHHHIEKGNRDFKANNNWTSGLARWAMDVEPRLRGFFETRALHG